MVTKYATATKTARRTPVRLPDLPMPKMDEMTTYEHISATGNAHYLIDHFGNPEATLVKSDRYLQAAPRVHPSERRIPDLLIAFDSDPELYEANNGDVVSEQGKPPDFVLEVASQGTWRRDRYAKREDYQAMGIPEYWRFDETGEYYGERLAGDILVEGEYRPVAIETVEEGVLQGYSPALKLNVRWVHGELRWHNPETARYIDTLQSEREAHAQTEQALLQTEQARHAAEQGRESERRGRLQSEQARLQSERAHAQSEQARLRAEARVRELEELLRQRDT